MKMFNFSKNASIAAAVNYERVIDRLNEMRDEDCNKGTFGTLTCVCGSYGMAGAAMLCGSAAVTAGAGLVKMVLPDVIYPIAAANLWENVFVPLPATESGTLRREDIEKITQEANAGSAVVVGCGMRVNDDTVKITDALIKNCERPLILDADALNGLSSHTEFLKDRTAPTVLTPHPGEMARLCRCTVAEIQQNRQKIAEEKARDLGCVIVLKGVDTIITDGEDTFINPTGNGCLAKGGSGDVLAGIIGALICQGTAPLEASAAGAYLHGFAADECIDDFGTPCVTGRDVINAIKYIM